MTTTTRSKPTPAPGLLHVFRPAGYLGLICVMCHGQADFLTSIDADHGDDCAGWIEPVPYGTQLAGSDTL